MKTHKNIERNLLLKTTCILLFLVCYFLPTTASAQYRWKRIFDDEIYCIVANPQNPKTLYVGGPSGSFHRSFNAGLTWDTTIIFKLGVPDITALFVDPIDTNVVLLGGEGMPVFLRSKDIGKTWQVLLGSDTSVVTVACDVIFSDPQNPNFLYMADTRGIFYSSIDHGQTWEKISYMRTVSLTHTANCIVTRPDSSNIIIAGCQHGHIIKSQDTGKTWKEATIQFPYPLGYNIYLETPEMAFSPNNPLIGYAVMTYTHNVVVWPNCGMYKTTDGGDTWAQIAYKDTSMWAIAIRAKNGSDELFTGGFSTYAPFPNIVGAGIVKFSPDGGNIWRDFPPISWLSNDPNYPGNVWMLRFIGTPPNDKLYMASDQGLFVMEPDPAGIEESKPTADTRLSISQNGRIYFQSEASSTSFRIANLLGQTVAEGKLNERDGDFAVGEFSIAGLPHGVYVVQVSDGKTSLAKVFVAGE